MIRMYPDNRVSWKYSCVLYFIILIKEIKWLHPLTPSLFNSLKESLNNVPSPPRPDPGSRNTEVSSMRDPKWSNGVNIFTGGLLNICRYTDPDRDLVSKLRFHLLTIVKSSTPVSI